MKLTKLQRELLLHRLDLDDCIAEVIANTRLENCHQDADYNRQLESISETIATKCNHLADCVRKGYLPWAVTNDRDYADIIEDACDGSTFFANEDDSIDCAGTDPENGHDAAWWKRRHAAADDLEFKLTDLLGRKITFARY